MRYAAIVALGLALAGCIRFVAEPGAALVAYQYFPNVTSMAVSTGTVKP